MRKLASIQKVLEVEPIEGADKIEKIKILGWQLVAKRGEFAPGDLAIYLEIDSLIPYRSDLAFLWSKASEADQPQPLRLRSKRMRGVLSQGLALPLSLLFTESAAEEVADVTE